jgi:hypothetical protein
MDKTTKRVTMFASNVNRHIDQGVGLAQHRIAARSMMIEN